MNSSAACSPAMSRTPMLLLWACSCGSLEEGKEPPAPVLISLTPSQKEVGENRAGRKHSFLIGRESVRKEFEARDTVEREKGKDMEVKEGMD